MEMKRLRSLASGVCSRVCPFGTRFARHAAGDDGPEDDASGSGWGLPVGAVSTDRAAIGRAPLVAAIEHVGPCVSRLGALIVLSGWLQVPSFSRLPGARCALRMPDSTLKLLA